MALWSHETWESCPQLTGEGVNSHRTLWIYTWIIGGHHWSKSCFKGNALSSCGFLVDSGLTGHELAGWEGEFAWSLRTLVWVWCSFLATDHFCWEIQVTYLQQQPSWQQPIQSCLFSAVTLSYKNYPSIDPRDTLQGTMNLAQETEIS